MALPLDTAAFIPQNIFNEVSITGENLQKGPKMLEDVQELWSPPNKAKE